MYSINSSGTFTVSAFRFSTVTLPYKQHKTGGAVGQTGTKLQKY